MATRKLLLYIYFGIAFGLFLFSTWAGSTGKLLPQPDTSPPSIRKESIGPGQQRTHTGTHHHRHYWPGGTRGGK